MKKAVIAVIVAVGFIIGATYYFLTRCEEPADVQGMISQFLCIRAIDEQALFTKACKDLHNAEYPCEFTAEDEPALYKALGAIVNDCVEKDMKSQNLCTDKIPRL